MQHLRKSTVILENFSIAYRVRWFVHIFSKKISVPTVSFYYNGLHKAMSKIKIKSVLILTRFLHLEVAALATSDNFKRKN